MKFNKNFILAIYFWFSFSMEFDENMLEEISNAKDPEDMSDTLLAFRKRSFDREDVNASGTFLDPSYSVGMKTWIREKYIDSLSPVFDTALDIEKDKAEQIYVLTPEKSTKNNKATTEMKIKFEKIATISSGKRFSNRLLDMNDVSTKIL